MEAEPIPHELLLRHAGSLRRLAHDLVADSAAAEDAVQEVWVRALESPPKHHANLRAWMRIVLTNLVRTKVRRDARREVRERDHVEERGQDALVLRSEDEVMLRSVTEAVLALDEPLRGTVLQHYFQDLTTAEIATRENLPISTVKSRLQRALEILRARMEREHRDDERSWKSSLLALASSDRARHWAPHAAPAAKAGTGVLLMAMKTKLMLGCAAALAVWFLFQEFAPRPSGASSRMRPSSDLAVDASASKDKQPSPNLALEAGTAPAQRGNRETASVPAVSGPGVERPQTLFYGALLDPEGNPIRGAWFAGASLTDINGRSRYCDAKTEGTFAFHALPFGKYWVSASAEGFHGNEDVIELDPSHAQLLKDYKLSRAPILKIRVVTPQGELLSAALGNGRNRLSYPVLVPVATKTSPGKWFKEVFGSLNNPFGIGQFWDYGPRVEGLGKGYMGILLLKQDPPVYVSLLNFHRVLQTKEVKPGDEEVQFVVPAEDLLSSMASIRMQIVDADTRTPIQGANVQFWGGPSMGAGVESDANGNAVIESHEPGEFSMHIRVQNHEEYVARILADSGTITELGQIPLEKGIQFEAKVLDGMGNPKKEQFELGVLNPSTNTLEMERQRSYRSDGDGLLKFENLGRRVYVIRSTNHDAVNEQAEAESKFVSGNVLVDLRSGAAPVNFVIHLVPASIMMLLIGGGFVDGRRFRIIDEGGIDLVSSAFYGSGPRAVTLPHGKYRVALLDENKTVLNEQSVTLESQPITLELSR
jgi:RNA polymerase sigma factor (sigma-70 family)